MERPAEDTLARSLPSVDRVLRAPVVSDLLGEFDHGSVVSVVRSLLDRYRSQVLSGGTPPSLDDIAREVADSIEREWAVGPVRVINATGVILHTNLGRAPLSEPALRAVVQAAGYSDLELNAETGKRDTRQRHVQSLLRLLTGAEAVHVTSNNAAAVILALAALARGKEVIVSRGQAVEIGGGFRVPSIMRQSGARLVEVGTTNRTRIDDYAAAITPRTAAILHVHRSNFKVVGFAEDVGLGPLAELAQAHGLVLIDDNGSGSLLDTSLFGLGHEPTPVESLGAGVDLVSFSADKLLGGPQAGILAGRSGAIAAAARHPLARAIRPDKMALAALAATLKSYARGDAVSTLPVWQMISAGIDDIRRRAAAWSAQSARLGVQADMIDGESTVGGGALPEQLLPTVLLRLPREFTAARLRLGSPPVVARTHGGHVLLDLRTVLPEQDADLLKAVSVAFHSP